MKCHYEVLGVDANCSSDDLKKSYRKLALEWHPDKNLDRLEEAKETFQIIQQAYDILTDPQERAWYDRHREDILRGDAEEAYKHDCLNVYQYFSTTCFKGYNDDEKGFYTVYREVFENIAAEDRPFMEEDIEIPQFGYSYSSYEEVVHIFYAYWQSYCTIKSYSWVDKFDLCEGRKSGAGRQIIRMMEKENKKLRDQHKKLRNEEVRELVAFVRKRDKRVQAHKKKIEEIRAEKAKRTEEMRKKQLQERNKALEEYKECEWSSIAQFEDHFNEMENVWDAECSSNSADVNECDDLYCVACEKEFRSEKAMKNHENSKKHKENVAVLKALMEEEEESTLENGIATEENDENNYGENSENSNSEEISSEALLDELIKSSTKTKKKKKKNKITMLEEEKKDQITDLHEIDLKLQEVEINDTSFEENLVAISNLHSESDSLIKKSKKCKTLKDATSVSERSEDKNEKQSTVCEKCNTNFLSRNKLFEHLKESGHAVYKNETSSKNSKSGSARKHQRKK